MDSYQATRWRNVLRCLVIVACVTAVCILIEYVLTPGNWYAAVPFYEDDYYFSTLSLSTYTMGPRPIADMIAVLLNYLPLQFFYLAMHVSLIVYAVLVFCYIIELFEIRNQIHWYHVAAFATIEFCYSFTIIMPRRLGHLPQVGSSGFGTIALLLLLKSRRNGGTLARSGAYFFLALAFTAASIFSKEDFIPVIVLMTGLWTWDQMQREDRRGIRILAFPAALCGLLAIWFFYNTYLVYSPAIVGNDPSYAHSFNPINMLRIGSEFLFPGKSVNSGGYRTAVSFVFLAAGMFLIVAVPKRSVRKAALLALLLVAGLVVPYSVLINKTAMDTYPFNWLPWEAGLIVVATVFLPESRLQRPRRAAKPVAVALLVVGALACVAFTQTARRNTSYWMRGVSTTVGGMLQTLAEHRAELNRYPLVGVDLGPNPVIPNPWYRVTDNWLYAKWGLHNKWLVLVGESSPMYAVRNDFHYFIPPVAITVVGRSERQNRCDIPVLEFDQTGKGTLVAPADGCGH